MSMNEGVRHINEIIRQIRNRSILPMRLLDVARMIEDYLPQNESSDGIRFYRPRGSEWLNVVFQRHINLLESDLVEAGQFTSGPPTRFSFFPARTVADRLREESTLEKSRGVPGAGSWARHPWRGTRRSLPHSRAQ